MESVRAVIFVEGWSLIPSPAFVDSSRQRVLALTRFISVRFCVSRVGTTAKINDAYVSKNFVKFVKAAIFGNIFRNKNDTIF